MLSNTNQITARMAFSVCKKMMEVQKESLAESRGGNGIQLAAAEAPSNASSDQLDDQNQR